ncbi:hypothetical protein OIE69_43930 (plasmid) [Actinacidiphila glaucinigra]|uniref:hypothetical protein n=1 Tax=Actinacidiphila glaucinigra TaxID=235986 RepID=UPI002DD7A195|nr:hypothetical protein [Actinacidiphila glaucinigra]WSD65855.1 hypothetical protein OIE69_43930 [Actinacidiphila glaucinigra]
MTIFYVATRPDGVIPASADARTPVNLSVSVGRTVIHPNQSLIRSSHAPFSYFSCTSESGEVLEGYELWPARLFIVEPVGETSTPDPQFRPYLQATHSIRVVEETDHRRALGPRGHEVLTAVENLPQRIHQWAQAWDTNPLSTYRALEEWRLPPKGAPMGGGQAQNSALEAAYAARRGAAHSTAQRLAVWTTKSTCRGTPFTLRAVEYASTRATNLVTAELLRDRLPIEVTRKLLAEGLDI